MVFKQLVRVMAAILVLLVFAVILGRCSGNRVATTKTVPQLAESATEAILTGSDPATELASGDSDVRILLVGPAVLQVGQDPQNVEVQLSGSQSLGELTLEIATGAPNTRVVDTDNETPGIQVSLAALPDGATVNQLTVDDQGILRYRMQNFVASGAYNQRLLMFQVQGVIPGVGAIVAQQAAAIAPDGAPIAVDWGAVLQVQVQDAAVQPIPTVVSVAEVTTPTSIPGEIAPGIYYRIRRGQNLFRLGQAFGVAVEALAQVNGITDARQIPTGMLLRIPTTSPKGQAAYLVGPDETLYAIAGTFGMTVEQLAQMNGIAPPYLSQAGDYLLLRP